MNNFFQYETKCLALIEKYKGKTCDYLFIGDSWLEYWTREEKIECSQTFFDDVKKYGINAINVGVGGTTYADWENWTEELVLPYKAKKIFICLGSNEMEREQTPQQGFEHFLNLINRLKESGAKIYVTQICHTPGCWKSKDKEETLDNLIREYAIKTGDVIYLPLQKEFERKGKDMAYYCVSDKIHLNRLGYDAWGIKAIESLIEND